MTNRHDIDEKVMNFLFENFTENNSSDSSIYVSKNDKVALKIWKHNLLKDGKIEMFISPKEGDHYHEKECYTFSKENSDRIRKFFEELEDKNNQEYIENHNKKILDLIS